MNSVLPQTKPSLKAKRTQKSPEDNYRKLASPAEETDDIPEVLTLPESVNTKTRTKKKSELLFNIGTGSKRTPKAVLDTVFTFSQSNNPTLSSRMLTRTSMSECLPGRTVQRLDILDNESDEEEVTGEMEGDAADPDDFMLEQEPELFPSMPCSKRASIVEVDNEKDPLGGKKLSTLTTSADGTMVPLSAGKGESVFGVGFTQSPNTKEKSNRETVMWNINDIPIS